MKNIKLKKTLGLILLIVIIVSITEAAEPSLEKTYRIQLHNNLPIYTIAVGNSQIKVFSKQSREPIQTLKIPETGDTGHSLNHPLRGIDLDFDGYKDLSESIKCFAVSEDENDCDLLVWLFDPKSKRFRFSNNYSTSMDKSGCCYHRHQVYLDQQNNELLIYEESVEIQPGGEEEAGDRYLFLSRVREGGNMVEYEKDHVFYKQGFIYHKKTIRRDGELFTLENSKKNLYQEIKRTYQKALKEYRKGNKKKASILLEAEFTVDGKLNELIGTLLEEEKEKYIIYANDFGFFLEQSGDYYKAIKVLKHVIFYDPNRIVAYLNIADALYSYGSKKESLKYYQDYRALMISNGKKSKIPVAVEKRIRELAN